jgi:hypothetical protein
MDVAITIRTGIIMDRALYVQAAAGWWRTGAGTGMERNRSQGGPSCVGVGEEGLE